MNSVITTSPVWITGPGWSLPGAALTTLVQPAEVPGGELIGESLAECIAALSNMGLGDFVDIDLSIVRGLAYYTGIVFELFDASRSSRAICGGGRYDGLLQELGGVDLPGVGFGMGDVVIADLLRQQSSAAIAPTRLDVFLVAVTNSDVPEVLRLSHALRDQGVRVEYALKQQAVSKQLRIAAVRRSKHAVLIGPEEREAGTAVVRNMDTGAEKRASLAGLTENYAWP